jgi:hypothetical protein
MEGRQMSHIVRRRCPHRLPLPHPLPLNPRPILLCRPPHRAKKSARVRGREKGMLEVRMMTWTGRGMTARLRMVVV